MIGSDIARGQDALTYAPAAFDACVGNPPFSLKQEFLARFFALGRPFALLMPVTVFDSEERREMMHRHHAQVLFPNGRINFETPNHVVRAADGLKSSAWFYSIWVCWLSIGAQD